MSFKKLYQGVLVLAFVCVCGYIVVNLIQAKQNLNKASDRATELDKLVSEFKTPGAGPQNDRIPLPGNWRNGIMRNYEEELEVAHQGYKFLIITVMSRPLDRDRAKMEFHLGVIKGYLYSASLRFEEWTSMEKALVAENASPEVFEATRVRVLTSFNLLTEQTNEEVGIVMALLSGLSPEDYKQEQEKRVPASKGTSV